jgi:hypothetical protein
VVRNVRYLQGLGGIETAEAVGLPSHPFGYRHHTTTMLAVDGACHNSFQHTFVVDPHSSFNHCGTRSLPSLDFPLSYVGLVMTFKRYHSCLPCSQSGLSPHSRFPRVHSPGHSQQCILKPALANCLGGHQVPGTPTGTTLSPLTIASFSCFFDGLALGYARSWQAVPASDCRRNRRGCFGSSFLRRTSRSRYIIDADLHVSHCTVYLIPNQTASVIFSAETTLDLSHCPALCQLQIGTTHLRVGEQALISSVASLNFRKVVFALSLLSSGGVPLGRPR